MTLKFGNFFILVFCMLFFADSYVWAELIEDESLETVVTDFYEIKNFSSPSSLVLTEEQLNKSHSLSEILKQQTSLEVLNAGGPYQPTSIFIRGAQADHTMILVDGVEVFDASSTGRTYDLSLLSNLNIERIEILKGPQAMRYGSDAIGGVILIWTKKGISTGSSKISVEAGSFDSRSLQLSHTGEAHRLSYVLGGAIFQSASFSSADAGKHAEKDAVTGSKISSRLDYRISENSKLKWTSRWSENHIELDSGGGSLGDDPNYNSQILQNLNGLEFLTDGIAQGSKAIASYSRNGIQRKYKNLPDPLHSDEYLETFDSLNEKLEVWQHDQSFSFGVQHRQETGKSEQYSDGVFSALNRKTQYVTGIASIYHLQAESYEFELGLRQDKVKNQQQSVTNSSFGVKRKINSSTVGLLFGTGFKVPSLYQLYSNFGDPSLRVEKAQSFELFYETRWLPHQNLRLSLFENLYQNLIDFESQTSKYRNIGQAVSRGFELQNNWKVSEKIEVVLSGLHLATEDKRTKHRLLRRPNNTIAVQVQAVEDQHEFNLQYRWVDSRDDIDPVNFQRLTLSPYDLVQLSYGHELKTFRLKHLKPKLDVRIENLFDRSYAEIAGYQTARRSFFLGLSAQF